MTPTPSQPDAVRQPTADVMGLPDGKTCADCYHAYRCAALGYSWPEREVCDFYPIRFHDVAGSRERAR